MYPLRQSKEVLEQKEGMLERRRMLRKCVWCSSYMVVRSLSSKLYSNCDFIYFTEGSLASWGENGLALNRYQGEKKVGQLLP